MDTIKKQIGLHEAIAAAKTEELGFPVSREDVFWALLMRVQKDHQIEHPVELWSIEITPAQAWGYLEGFDFSIFSKTVACDLIPDELLFQKKVRIKSKGQVWVVHRYDADPFPSNPHAHCCEQNFKLDLSNGRCYQGRVYRYKVPIKDLLRIRKLLEGVYKGDLPALDLQNSGLIK